MRLIDADLFMQRIESYNTLDERDKALYNFALNEIVCMPTVDVLDKIRAEIEQYEVECMLILPMTEQTCNRCTNDTFKDIYQIIDKYTK